MKKLFIALAALAMLSFAFAQTTVDMSDRTIGEILDETDQVSILNAMVEFAGLDETLSDEGPFTVFAPVDRAWTVLDTSTINGLIRNPETLQAVLLYHVVSGEVDSDRLFELLLTDARQRLGDDTTAGMEVSDPVDALDEAETEEEAPLDDQAIGEGDLGNLDVEGPVEALLATGVTSAATFESVQGSTLEVRSELTTDTTPRENGQRIGEGDELLGITEPVAALRAEGAGLLVNNANIVSVDIIASNGVIHLIDGLLVPADVQLPR